MGKSIERIFTSSASPGSAPSTNTGPVRMCPPGPRLGLPLGNAAVIFLSESWILSSGTPARDSPIGEFVSSVSTSMMSPDAMRSTGFASDQ